MVLGIKIFIFNLMSSNKQISSEINRQNQNQPNKNKIQSIDNGDFYSFKSSFNGEQISMSLTYFKDDIVTVFEGSFPESLAHVGLIKYYGSWQNVYINCFHKKAKYEIITQGQNRLIQLYYKTNFFNNKEVKAQKFQLFKINISPQIQIQKLREIIEKKDLDKIQLKKQLQSSKGHIKKKVDQIQQVKTQLQELYELCNQASLPLFIKNKDLQMIQRCSDPNYFRYVPVKPDAKPAYLILRNKIKQDKQFILKINFQPIMRTQRHSIGIVDGDYVNDISRADLKIMYDFKGEMVFGQKNRIPCQDMKIMRYNQIQMVVDYKQNLVQFRRDNQTFASSYLKSFARKNIKPFVKIGQYGMKYRISVA